MLSFEAKYKSLTRYIESIKFILFLRYGINN